MHMNEMDCFNVPCILFFFVCVYVAYIYNSFEAFENSILLLVKFSDALHFNWFHWRVFEIPCYYCACNAKASFRGEESIGEKEKVRERQIRGGEKEINYSQHSYMQTHKIVWIQRNCMWEWLSTWATTNSIWNRSGQPSQ